MASERFEKKTYPKWKPFLNLFFLGLLVASVLFAPIFPLWATLTIFAISTIFFLRQAFNEAKWISSLDRELHGEKNFSRLPTGFKVSIALIVSSTILALASVGLLLFLTPPISVVILMPIIVGALMLARFFVMRIFFNTTINLTNGLSNSPENVYESKSIQALKERILGASLAFMVGGNPTLGGDNEKALSPFHNRFSITLSVLLMASATAVPILATKTTYLTHFAGLFGGAASASGMGATLTLGLASLMLLAVAVAELAPYIMRFSGSEEKSPITEESEHTVATPNNIYVNEELQGSRKQTSSDSELKAAYFEEAEEGSSLSRLDREEEGYDAPQSSPKDEDDKDWVIMDSEQRSPTQQQ